jgi:hypothetical protein
MIAEWTWLCTTRPSRVGLAFYVRMPGFELSRGTQPTLVIPGQFWTDNNFYCIPFAHAECESPLE